MDACREAGLLVLTAGEKVLRLAPPLIVEAADCERALEILGDALGRRRQVTGTFSRSPISRASGSSSSSRWRPTSSSGWKAGRRAAPLAGRSLALIFEKQSLRTRVTFEVGIVQLGGRAVYLAGHEIGLGTRESVPDVARNLSRWVDGIAARVYAHATVEDAGPLRDRARDQRAHRLRASLPGAGRLLHAVGARRRPGVHAAGLDRRRQQRLPLA